MRDYCDRILVSSRILSEERKDLFVQELIGSLCHGLFAFHIDKTCIDFVFVAMKFAPRFLRISGTGLERFAFIISEVLSFVNDVQGVAMPGCLHLFDQSWDFDNIRY